MSKLRRVHAYFETATCCPSRNNQLSYRLVILELTFALVADRSPRETSPSSTDSCREAALRNNAVILRCYSGCCCCRVNRPRTQTIEQRSSSDILLRQNHFSPVHYSQLGILHTLSLPKTSTFLFFE